MEMHTQSLWLTIADELLSQLSESRALVLDGFVGVGHALEAVSALVMLCDPRDIGQTMVSGEQETGAPQPDAPLDPTLFLFDAQPGGVGLSERLYERFDELLGRALALILGCPCALGCPACVGPTEGAYRKALSLQLLRELGASEHVLH
jgi:DEAD/DEAH box helicase domain-containing protein